MLLHPPAAYSAICRKQHRVVRCPRSRLPQLGARAPSNELPTRTCVAPRRSPAQVVAHARRHDRGLGYVVAQPGRRRRPRRERRGQFRPAVPSGATAITPASRNDGLAGDRVGQRRHLGRRNAPPRSGVAVDAQLHKTSGVRPARVARLAERVDQRQPVHRMHDIRRRRRPNGTCCAATGRRMPADLDAGRGDLSGLWRRPPDRGSRRRRRPQRGQVGDVAGRIGLRDRDESDLGRITRPAVAQADPMRARSCSRLAPISAVRASAPLPAPAVAAPMIDLPRNSWLPPTAAATPPGAPIVNQIESAPFFRKSGTSTSSNNTRRGVCALTVGRGDPAFAPTVLASVPTEVVTDALRDSAGLYAGVPPSNPAAITVTRTSSPSASSMTAPKMMFASGCAASVTSCAASLISNRPRSEPPAIDSSTPRAPSMLCSSSGLEIAASAASTARLSPRALPMPISALPHHS